MRDVAVETELGVGKPAGRYYYGWICVVVASLAMVATLPGRTMGLGLITEPLLRDLQMSRTDYATVNLWATLIGAGFGIGFGKLLDRFGARLVLSVITAALALVVLATTTATGFWNLLVWVTLTRGLGQSALSAASIALVGKWFERKADIAMGVYAVLLTMGFMGAFPGMEAAVARWGWRSAWFGMGLVLLVFVPIFVAFTRNSPEAVGATLDGLPQAESDEAPPLDGFTLEQALATPAFWAFALGGLVFNTVNSGVLLFNESILAEHGFGGSLRNLLEVVVVTGLISNGLAGWLASRIPIGRIMGAGMILLAGCLLLGPNLTSMASVMSYAALFGISGGIVTVVFFSYWGHAFGRLHLGRIQGAAQAITVLASAAGPLLLAEFKTRTGTYAGAFYLLIPFALALAVWCWVVRLPRREPAPAG
jgi:MFS family permease